MTEPHPPPDRWRDFLAGHVAGLEAAALDTHLQDCPTCAAGLAALGPTGGSFLDRLRSAADPGRPAPTGAFNPIPAAAAPVADDLPIGAIVAARFKLLERIGEGGMGAVYVAEQIAPIRRKVALKLIKLGMDSRSVLARFETERQALALMDHPNIAKVLDGGLTDQGRPFFVMEYIKGVPLTGYCDAAKLSVRERLGLFATVCQAVQHAHQKGIIHRDLKPSNVLIALYDGQPVPKVIDFGLAKAIHQPLTERSLYTGHQSVLGTPLYMSPEQSELNNLDVDTRTDIYSLGVMLYELLTGTTPLDRQRFHAAAWDEMMRLIREEEPPKPSTRLSTSEARASVATNRHTEPAKLSRLVHGDLDWIVMKALEKDRSRRYETANGLVRDIQRYLNDEAVEACPPSAGYRLRKFVRRNKGRVVAAALVLLALGVGMLGTTLGLFEARKQRDLAETARLQAESRLVQIAKANDILGSVFKDLDPKSTAKEDKPLQVLLGERLDQATVQIEGDAIGDPLAVAQMQMTLAESQLGLGYPEKAIGLFAKARATITAERGPDQPATLRSMNGLASSYQVAGKRNLALPLFEETLRLRKIWLGPDDRATLQSANNLAECHRAAGHFLLALPLYQETLELMKAKLGPNDPDTLEGMNNLAVCYQDAGYLDLALSQLGETLRLRKIHLVPNHRDTLESMNNLAVCYQLCGQGKRALKLFEETLPLRKEKLGPVHPDTLQSRHNLAESLRADGQLDVAIPMLKDSLKLVKDKRGPNHPDTLQAMNNLALGHQNQARNNLALGDQNNEEFDRALNLLEETLQLRKIHLAKNHPDTLMSMNNLAAFYHIRRRFKEARPLQAQTLALQTATLGPDHPNTLQSMNNLAWGYRADKDLDRACALFVKTLERQRLVLSPEHPATLQCILNLAVCYQDAERPDRAEPLFRELAEYWKRKVGVDSLQYAGALAPLGLNLLAQKRWTDAEVVIRDCLVVREAKDSDTWTTFNTKSLLGGSLLGQQKYADAEPLLLSGYEGLKQREGKIPPELKVRLTEATERLVRLYETTGKPDVAAKWRKELQAVKADSKP